MKPTGKSSQPPQPGDASFAAGAGRRVSVCAGKPVIVCPGDVLVQPFDLDAHLAGIPDNATTKGFFANQLVEYLHAVRPDAYPEFLDLHPERFPRFRDVPIREVLVQGFAVARLSHPDLPAPEALRRMGWRGYQNVLHSLLGKMLFATVGKDLDMIYGLGPRTYAYAEKNGTRLVHTRLGDMACRYDFDPCYGWLDSYQIGLVEGAADACGFATEIWVDLADRYHGSLECRWF